ncbi:hypothetical protein AB4059_06865 [Lysobacter sp. 2RAF19]|jgi:hypothetical protein
MTDLVLRDIDPNMADRIKRLADARGWSMHVTLENLLQRGLMACEQGLHVHFNDRESTALEQAIAAMEGVASDQGFGLIGRAPEPPAPTHILDRWVEDL